MSYIIENGMVFEEIVYETFSNKISIGSLDIIKTERIGTTDTVEDVSYTFDIAIGNYVENTAIPRVTRTEPLPPVPESDQQKIAKLEAKNTQLQQQLAQMNSDFTAFQDFYFEKNPTQA